MCSNKQNGAASQPLEVVPVSGYECGRLNESMLIWTLVSDQHLKDKLNNTVVKESEKYTCGRSQIALVYHYFGSENCACLHWAQAVTVRSQDLAIHHIVVPFKIMANILWCWTPMFVPQRGSCVERKPFPSMSEHLSWQNSILTNTLSNKM